MFKKTLTAVALTAITALALTGCATQKATPTVTSATFAGKSSAQAAVDFRKIADASCALAHEKGFAYTSQGYVTVPGAPGEGEYSTDPVFEIIGVPQPAGKFDDSVPGKYIHFGNPVNDDSVDGYMLAPCSFSGTTYNDITSGDQTVAYNLDGSYTVTTSIQAPGYAAFNLSVKDGLITAMNGVPISYGLTDAEKAQFTKVAAAEKAIVVDKFGGRDGYPDWSSEAAPNSVKKIPTVKAVDVTASAAQVSAKQALTDLVTVSLASMRQLGGTEYPGEFYDAKNPYDLSYSVANIYAPNYAKQAHAKLGDTGAADVGEFQIDTVALPALQEANTIVTANKDGSFTVNIGSTKNDNLSSNSTFYVLVQNEKVTALYGYSYLQHPMIYVYGEPAALDKALTAYAKENK
jgi:hypothetical protein